MRWRDGEARSACGIQDAGMLLISTVRNNVFCSLFSNNLYISFVHGECSDFFFFFALGLFSDFVRMRCKVLLLNGSSQLNPVTIQVEKEGFFPPAYIYIYSQEISSAILSSTQQPLLTKS